MATDFEELVEAWRVEYSEIDDGSLASLKAHAKAFFEGATGKAVVFQFNCQKVKYGHLETAQEAAAHMEAKTGDKFDCYQCERCDDAWHIGHSRKRGN